MERRRLAVRGLGLAAFFVFFVFVDFAVFAVFVTACPASVAAAAGAEAPTPAASSGAGRTPARR